MKKRQHIKVYIKESSIPDIGKGLFANEDIKKGSIVVEFRGKLRKPGEIPRNNRSNVYFEDEYMLESSDDDFASFANDAINFPKERRYLMETLKKDEPLYRKYPNININASIKINNKLHRAFLIADDDIKSNEEIFCHYGFGYWFTEEIGKIGFLQDDEIIHNGFPEKIFEYPAFIQYIKEFYPKTSRIEVMPFKDFFDVVIYFNDGSHNVIPMTNYSKSLSRVIVS